MDNPALRLAGIAICRVNLPIKDAKGALEQRKTHFKGLVCDTLICDTVKLRECNDYRLPVKKYDPSRVVSADCRVLAKRVMRGETNAK